MTSVQKAAAQKIMQRNLAEHADWIALNNTMETLFAWSRQDAGLAAWLRPHLERLAGDTRKSVARRAAKRLEVF